MLFSLQCVAIMILSKQRRLCLRKAAEFYFVVEILVLVFGEGSLFQRIADFSVVWSNWWSLVSLLILILLLLIGSCYQQILV